MTPFRPHRWGVPLLTLLMILGLGLAIHYWPDAPPPVSTPAPPTHREVEIRQRFEQGVAMLHIKQYEYAVTAFHWVLQQAPEMPEAHVNMGFALLGLAQPQAAQDFFQSAITLRTTQVNAYYGLALALAARQDMEGARGAMHTFIHLTPKEDPFLARARDTLQQWQEKPAQPVELPAPPPADRQPQTPGEGAEKN